MQTAVQTEVGVTEGADVAEVAEVGEVKVATKEEAMAKGAQAAAVKAGEETVAEVWMVAAMEGAATAPGAEAAVV